MRREHSSTHLLDIFSTSSRAQNDVCRTYAAERRPHAGDNGRCRPTSAGIDPVVREIRGGPRPSFAARTPSFVTISVGNKAPASVVGLGLHAAGQMPYVCARTSCKPFTCERNLLLRSTLLARCSAFNSHLPIIPVAVLQWPGRRSLSVHLPLKDASIVPQPCITRNGSGLVGG